MLARSVATHIGLTRARERPVATPASSPKVVIFGSARAGDVRGHGLCAKAA